MTADEMFEKIGYKKTHEISFDEPPTKKEDFDFKRLAVYTKEFVGEFGTNDIRVIEIYLHEVYALPHYDDCYFSMKEIYAIKAKYDEMNEKYNFSSLDT